MNITITPRHPLHDENCIVMGPDGTPYCLLDLLPLSDVSRTTEGGRARLCALLEMTTSERAADYAAHANR
jgi:hypothetical protein